MIVNRQRNVRFARKPLQTFLVRAQKELGVQDFGITVCFVSDKEIAGMNERFRKKSGPTDVLSFPAANKRRVLAGGRKETYTETAEKGKKKTKPLEAYLGDIAIAPETARRYAKESGRSLHDELRVLILHGVLHLMGYDHETDQGEMSRLERNMRRRFRLA